MEWHPSHEVETPKDRGEHCVKCGIWLGEDRLDDHSDYAKEPCNPSYWHKGYDGHLIPYFIPPDEIEPMPSPKELRKVKRFWNSYGCQCEADFSIGYRLARHTTTGDFCIACDSDCLTSKHHCHCPICGGINQVG